MAKKRNVLLLIIVLLTAGIFRIWKLENIPPGLYPDVALNGTEAFLSLKNRDYKVFYSENYGREGLMIWLIAISFSIFGVSLWSIKIVAAFIGILTVFALYLLVKELFSERTAILSAFFMATSFWHTLLSRIGFRVILLPFFLTLSFYFLFKALKEKRLFYSFFAGVFFGLGFYTYTSFRMAVLILPFFLLLWPLYEKKEKINFVKIFLCFLITTFIFALPIGIYFLKNPNDFISRATPVTVFSAKNPSKEFLKSLIVHLGMFNFYGDPNWRHNFSKHPMLFWPVGILFLIGIFRMIKNSLKFSLNPKFSIYNLQFLIWFLVMLLAGILTIEGIPHSLRVAGTIPPVFVFAGMGADLIFEEIEKRKRYFPLLKNVGILILILIAIFEFYRYFFIWANKPEVKSEFTEELLKMGNYLNSLPENVERYVIVNRGGMKISWANNLPISSQPIMFLEFSKYGKLKSNYLLPEDLEKIKIEKEGVILFLTKDEKLLEIVREKFPGKLIENEYFWAWYVVKPN